MNPTQKATHVTDITVSVTCKCPHCKKYVSVAQAFDKNALDWSGLLLNQASCPSCSNMFDVVYF